MNKTDQYINNYKLRNGKKLLKEEVIFGQTTGLILIVLFGFKYLQNITPSYDVLYIALIILGFILLSCGLIYPSILYYPNKFLKKIFNIILNLIISILLAFVYIIYLIPTSLLMRRKYVENYEFYTWNQEQKHNNRFRLIKLNQNNVLGVNNKYKKIFGIISYFYENGHYLLLPLIFLLILIGMLFFFVTSSIIAPMIYPFF